MDARISPKDEVRVRLSTEVLKYKIMEELKLIRDNYWATTGDWYVNTGLLL